MGRKSSRARPKEAQPIFTPPDRRLGSRPSHLGLGQEFAVPAKACWAGTVAGSRGPLDGDPTVESACGRNETDVQTLAPRILVPSDRLPSSLPLPTARNRTRGMWRRSWLQRRNRTTPMSAFRRSRVPLWPARGSVERCLPVSFATRPRACGSPCYGNDGASLGSARWQAPNADKQARRHSHHPLWRTAWQVGYKLERTRKTEGLALAPPCPPPPTRPLR